MNYLWITHMMCLLLASTLTCYKCKPPKSEVCEATQCVSRTHLCGALRFTSIACMLIFYLLYFGPFHCMGYIGTTKVTSLFQPSWSLTKSIWEPVFHRKNVLRTQSTLERPELWFPAIVAPLTCATPGRPLVITDCFNDKHSYIVCNKTHWCKNPDAVLHDSGQGGFREW